MQPVHAPSTARRAVDTLLDQDESTAKVPMFAQNLARRLVGMEGIVLSPPSACAAVVPAPSRPRPASARVPQIRPVTHSPRPPRRPTASIAEDESTTKVPAHVVADALAQADAVPPPLSRSGVVSVEPAPRRMESAPSLEVFETFVDEEDDSANDNLFGASSSVVPTQASPVVPDVADADLEVLFDDAETRLRDEPSAAEPPELTDEEIAASLGLSAPRPASASASSRRQSGPIFPWVASSLIAVASIVMCAATMLGTFGEHAVMRAPHVPLWTGAHACIAETPARTLATTAATTLAKREPVVAQRHRAPVMRSSAMSAPRVAPAAAAPPAASGIVRDVPF